MAPTSQQTGEDVAMRQGPLEGVRVVEIGSIGPGPFCAMLLADLGADVIRLDRPNEVGILTEEIIGNEVLHRSRRSVAIDLKHSGVLSRS